MSKLTAADREWIEQQLSEVVQPIDPSPDFVARAHAELMQININTPKRPSPSVLIALIFSVCGLIAALLLIGQRRQTR
jgi:hypothetical protein